MGWLNRIFGTPAAPAAAFPRTDLRVPFAEKDEAKSLGARWDPEQRVWYVPSGNDPAPFARWMARAPKITCRSPTYWIAETMTTCWKCSRPTSVFGYMIPPGGEVIFDEMEEWHQVEGGTFIHYITYLPQHALLNISSLTRSYRMDYSSTTQLTYFMNHCNFCGMKQGDFPLYCEPGDAFHPIDEHEASHITLYEIAQSLECEGTWIFSIPDLSSSMQKRRLP